jgi:hypothetical protein
MNPRLLRQRIDPWIAHRSVLVALLLLVGGVLAACGGAPQTPEEPAEPTEEPMQEGEDAMDAEITAVPTDEAMDGETMDEETTTTPTEEAMDGEAMDEETTATPEGTGRITSTMPSGLEAALDDIGPANQVYIAELAPMNINATEELVTGTALFIVEGDTLTMTVEASGLAPDMMHLQHLHGYTEEDGSFATCPFSGADANDDNVIDLLETRPFTGITLVPLHEEPASLAIQSQTYPTADAEGEIAYSQTVSIEELEQALQEEHNIDSLDLAQRTVFLHGVSQDADLPDSVESLPDVPAQVTLPVACGEIYELPVGILTE